MSHIYSFEDLSGGSPAKTTDKNPYQSLINDCKDDPAEIAARYGAHRTNRNAQQASKFTSPDFKGLIIDETLARLEDPTLSPGFRDWRSCLVFWARPPTALKLLIHRIQLELKTLLPHLWIMPADNLHMTVLEIAHSLSQNEIEKLLTPLMGKVPVIVNWTLRNRARLVRPVLSFDERAFALSFVPANGERGRGKVEDTYTYHHLRRDVFRLVGETGVEVASRYVVPSAHLTIARYIETTDLETPAAAAAAAASASEVEGGTRVDPLKAESVVEKVKEINRWLERDFWPQESDEEEIKPGGVWLVGEEKGLDCRRGTLWYGGGETVQIGEGY